MLLLLLRDGDASWRRGRDLGDPMQDTPILGIEARMADRVSRDWAALLDAIVGVLWFL